MIEIILSVIVLLTYIMFAGEALDTTLRKLFAPKFSVTSAVRLFWVGVFAYFVSVLISIQVKYMIFDFFAHLYDHAQFPSIVEKVYTLILLSIFITPISLAWFELMSILSSDLKGEKNLLRAYKLLISIGCLVVIVVSAFVVLLPCDINGGCL